MRRYSLSAISLLRSSCSRMCNAAVPAPNSSNTGRSMPSEYSVNGNGMCWNLTLDLKTLLPIRAAALKNTFAPLMLLESAATSRLTGTALRRLKNRVPVDRKNSTAVSGLLILGALCRMRSRLRNTLMRRQRSCHHA
ncbi:Uncharacterised protein [Mycobacteroides abscessus subsp. abscessus]|nr:Uncharacterised protein [Mycobacteroides abscessus subsp. abscessus]